MAYEYAKTISDTYADTVTVESDGGHIDDLIGSVYLTPAEGVSDFSFTPSQARALAKALKRAANVAEGKPAKAKRDGLYECLYSGGNVRTYMTTRTVEQIRNDYGIQAAGE